MAGDTTKTGRTMTEFDAIIDDVESTDYDAEALEARLPWATRDGIEPRRGRFRSFRPRAAIEARAGADHTSVSEIIRQAPGKFLDVA